MPLDTLPLLHYTPYKGQPLPVAEVWELCQQQLLTDLSVLSAVEIRSYHCPEGIKAFGKSRDYFSPCNSSLNHLC